MAVSATQVLREFAECSSLSCIQVITNGFPTYGPSILVYVATITKQGEPRVGKLRPIGSGVTRGLSQEGKT